MALILNIDTATPVCSVSLCSREGIISYTDSAEEKAHASHLAVFINLLLKDEGISVKQLDAVAVSKGPGSFTGLRIGVSVAKGLCYGSNIPLIAIDTLQSMALGMFDAVQKSEHNGFNPAIALYCPMIDARRMEVYTAVFDSRNQTVEETRAKIIDAESFADLLQNRQIVFSGSGADKCRDTIKNRNAHFLTGFNHSSRYMNSIAQEKFDAGKFEDVAYFEPFYLKDFLVTTPKRKVI